MIHSWNDMKNFALTTYDSARKAGIDPKNVNVFINHDGWFNLKATLDIKDMDYKLMNDLDCGKFVYFEITFIRIKNSVSY